MTNSALLACGCPQCTEAHYTLHGVTIQNSELEAAVREAFYAGARWSEAVAKYGRCRIGSEASAKARNEASTELSTIDAIVNRLTGR